MQDIKLQGFCYVLFQLAETYHPIAQSRHDLLWYPESWLSLLKQVQYTPYIQSIVTESPWLVGCYDREKVRIWLDGKWEAPSRQTFGANIDNIYNIMGINNTLPSMILDGGKTIEKLRKKLEKSYRKAQQEKI